MREPTKPPEKPRPSSLLSTEEWERPRTAAELAESKAAAKDLAAHRVALRSQPGAPEPPEPPGPPVQPSIHSAAFWEREPSDEKWTEALDRARQDAEADEPPVAAHAPRKTWPELQAEARQAIAREAAGDAAVPARSPAEALARAIARVEAAPAPEPPAFVDWDHRPAVLFSASRGEALALLRPGGAWMPVDALDVWNSGRTVVSAEALQGRFASTFGAFDVPESLAEAGRPARRLSAWRPQS